MLSSNKFILENIQDLEDFTMKKTFIALMAALCLGNVCNAQIADSSAALGGLTVGLPLNRVVEIYGRPQNIDQYNNLTYGNGTLKIMTNFKSRQVIDRIYVTGNNGFATPEGIRVGSSLNQLVNTYGNPDRRMPNLCAYISYSGRCLFFRHNGAKVTSIELHPFFS